MPLSSVLCTHGRQPGSRRNRKIRRDRSCNHAA
nr:MAG TPA: hypothetical protein [Caudoviricetes sp.]